MEKLTARKQRVLDALDEEIEALEQKLAKFQPFINELNQLKQTRRTLLAEKGTTGGGGHPGTQLTMEMVVQFMRSRNGKGVTPAQIAEHFGIGGQIVRSHLSRHNETRYLRDDDGYWYLRGETGAEDNEDDDEEE